MRAVVADDSLIAREGIVAETASAEELLHAVDRHRPDVAVVDVRIACPRSASSPRRSGAWPPAGGRWTRSCSACSCRGRATPGGWRRSASARRSTSSRRASRASIAKRLVVTEGAVQKHVGSIFATLGLPAGDDVNRRILAVLSYLSHAPP